MDMVEKVAKAINDTMLNYGDYKPIGLARAAIAAMREPTDEMLDAATRSEGDGNLETDARNTYHAMIDAALEEKK